ncbi:MAG: ArsC/Spx/MgsR family protein, partial [Pseudomonadota bacterium]
MVVVYGISNCDTVKKACRWLDKNNIDYRFHDFRKDGLSQSKLKSWLNSTSLEKLLNRRSLTWRNLPEHLKDGMNKSTAIKLMEEQP